MESLIGLIKKSIKGQDDYVFENSVAILSNILYDRKIVNSKAVLAFIEDVFRNNQNVKIRSVIEQRLLARLASRSGNDVLVIFWFKKRISSHKKLVIV